MLAGAAILLWQLASIVSSRDQNVVSLATAPHDEPDKIVNIIRIEAKNYKVLKAAIKKAGFQLLSAD